MVRTDVLQRGIPWTELILRTRFLPNDLNLSWGQRVSAGLSFLLVLLGGLGIGQVLSGYVLLPATTVAAGILLSLAIICVLNHSFYQFLASLKGWRFSLIAVLLHILYYLYSGISLLLGAASYALHVILPAISAEPSVAD